MLVYRCRMEVAGRADNGAVKDVEQPKDFGGEAPVIRRLKLLIDRAMEARVRHPHRNDGSRAACALQHRWCAARIDSAVGASRIVLEEKYFPIQPKSR